MLKKIYKRFQIPLRIIFSMIKTSYRNKKDWTNSCKPSTKSSFSILLSFDCHWAKKEPRNAVNSTFLGSCTVPGHTTLSSKGKIQYPHYPHIPLQNHTAKPHCKTLWHCSAIPQHIPQW